MKKGNAKQIQEGLSLAIPFYRYSIMNREPNDQHELLLNLDVGSNVVFYAAPRFHLVQELNVAYLANAIAASSSFIRPRDIGTLSYERHCVAYDYSQYFVCSEPREIHGQSGESLEGQFLERLSVDERPLQDGVLQDVLGTMESALKRLRISPQSIDAIPKPDRPLRMAHQIADLALRYFGAQFFVVQKIA